MKRFFKRIFSVRTNLGLTRFPGMVLEVPHDKITPTPDFHYIDKNLNIVADFTAQKKRLFRIELAISGYDNDPHPLAHISEVVKWAKQIYHKFPDFFLFLTPGSFLIFCSCNFPGVFKTQQNGDVEIKSLSNDKFKDAVVRGGMLICQRLQKGRLNNSRINKITTSSFQVTLNAIEAGHAKFGTHYMVVSE